MAQSADLSLGLWTLVLELWLGTFTFNAIVVWLCCRPHCLLFLTYLTLVWLL